LDFLLFLLLLLLGAAEFVGIKRKVFFLSSFSFAFASGRGGEENFQGGSPRMQQSFRFCTF
jgi:hypothetical protein